MSDDIRTIKLCHGPGEPGVSHCVMSATSIVAGEEFSDDPECVCPMIRDALIVLNDSFVTTVSGDAARSRLLGRLPWLIIGTRGSQVHVIQRMKLFAVFAARVAAPARIRALGASDKRRKALQGLPDDESALDEALKLLGGNLSLYCHDAFESVYKTVLFVNGEDPGDVAAHAAEAAINAGVCREFVQYIERRIIPVYTTMPVEPGHRINELIHEGCGA